MKKLLSAMTAALLLTASLTACGSGSSTQSSASGSASESSSGAQSSSSAAAQGTTYNVAICQLMVHPSLDEATQGFKDALTEALESAGNHVEFDTQVAGEANLCTTVVGAQLAKQPDLMMANGTPALLAAANGTTEIPVLGTSVTDYADTFAGNIPANVSGTSDAVPFDEQAQMMIDSLGLVEGDQVGVLYCTNESNSLVQYEAVKELFESKGIVVKAYTFSETTELQAVTTSMASECKAVYVPSDNTVAANDTIVGTICTEKNVPIYTSYGGAVCYASLSIDYYELGVETGKMAAQILMGETDIADTEIMTLTPSVSYNEELCAQLGIEVPAN